MHGSPLVACKQNAVLIFYIHLFIKIMLAIENSTENSCPISTVLSAILIAMEHICIDFPANSAPISVEYSYLHVPCTHGCFV